MALFVLAYVGEVAHRCDLAASGLGICVSVNDAARPVLRLGGEERFDRLDPSTVLEHDKTAAGQMFYARRCRGMRLLALAHGVTNSAKRS